jgi:hypothetical protein
LFVVLGASNNLLRLRCVHNLPSLCNLLQQCVIMEQFSSSNYEFAIAAARLSIVKRKGQMRRSPLRQFHSLSFDGHLLNLNFKFKLIILTCLVPSLRTRLLLLLLIRSQSSILLCPCVICLELIIPGLLCASRNRTVSHVLTRGSSKCIALPH